MAEHMTKELLKWIDEEMAKDDASVSGGPWEAGWYYALKEVKERLTAEPPVSRKPLGCDYCTQSFYTVPERVAHVKQEHPGCGFTAEPSASPNAVETICECCTARFVTNLPGWCLKCKAMADKLTRRLIERPALNRT